MGLLSGHGVGFDELMNVLLGSPLLLSRQHNDGQMVFSMGWSKGELTVSHHMHAFCRARLDHRE